MKRGCIIALIWMLTVHMAAGQSLDDYLMMADQNNPMLKAKLEEFEAAMQKIPQVGSLADPTVTVAAFGQMVETRVGQQMARISLSQMFPWFGTLAAQKNAAALQAQANYESYVESRNKLHFMIRKTYYELVELEQVIELQNENIEILETYKILATTKFQNGRGKLADALRVDLMLNDLRNEIEIITMKRKPLQTSFNKLLNRSVDDEIVVDSVFAPVEVWAIVADSIVANNPRVQLLSRRVESAQAMERVAERQGMPKIGLGFEYIITSKRPNMDFADNGKDAWMPMVSVSLPIYRKKYRAAISESQHMQESYKAMMADTQNELITEYELTSYDRAKAIEEITLFELQTTQTKQIVDLLVSEFSSADADFEEILRMQQKLLAYELSTTKSKKDFHTAQARLLYLSANE